MLSFGPISQSGAKEWRLQWRAIASAACAAHCCWRSRHRPKVPAPAASRFRPLGRRPRSRPLPLLAAGLLHPLPAHRATLLRSAPERAVPARSLVARAARPVAQAPGDAYGAALAGPDELGGPRRPAGPALIVSAVGLILTIVASANLLSTTGTIATLASSFAGLFAFKLTKELSNRGVNRGTFKQVAVGTGKLGVKSLLALGIAVAYAAASLVSLVVWMLTRLGESVLYVAEMTMTIFGRLVCGLQACAYTQHHRDPF